MVVDLTESRRCSSPKICFSGLSIPILAGSVVGTGRFPTTARPFMLDSRAVAVSSLELLSSSQVTDLKFLTKHSTRFLLLPCIIVPCSRLESISILFVLLLLRASSAFDDLEASVPDDRIGMLSVRGAGGF